MNDLGIVKVSRYHPADEPPPFLAHPAAYRNRFSLRLMADLESAVG
jgi:hypothetical protein